MVIQTENRKVESSQNKDKQNKFLTHKRFIFWKKIIVILNWGSAERDEVN